MSRNDMPLAAENGRLRRCLEESERDLSKVERDWAGGRHDCRSTVRRVLARLRIVLDGAKT